MEKHRDRQKKDRQTLTDRHEEMKGHPHKQVLNKIKTKLESKKSYIRPTYLQIETWREIHVGQIQARLRYYLADKTRLVLRIEIQPIPRDKHMQLGKSQTDSEKQREEDKKVTHTEI